MKLFRWFFNLKTSVKLVSAFLIVAILQVGVGFVSNIQMGKLNESIEDMYSKNLQPIQQMSEVRDLFQQLSISSRDLYFFDSQIDVKNMQAEIEKSRSEIENFIDLYSTKSLTQEQEELLERFSLVWSTYNHSYNTALQMINDGKKQEYVIYLNGNLRNMQNGLVETLDRLIETEASLAEKANKEAKETYQTSTLINIGNNVLTVIISIAFGLFIARVIAGPLRKVVDLVEKVAEGDLTETSNINTRDEVGLLARSVNKMIVNLRGIIQNILSAAENLSASSAQVSASTEEIASASTNQANAAQTMNELFRELSDAIHAVAQNTEHAAELASETIKIAEDGEKVVRSSVEGAQLVSEQMALLEKDSHQIGAIIEVIDDIADQTNLLALNAAIEAARAGEQGRGFAVVADEVRKLAERSGEATTQITSIIKKMQEATAVSVKSVEEGVSYTRQSGEAFENIIHMIHDTGQKVTEIAGASEEQAAQSAEVLSFIENISAATEEATASSEETASTALALTDLAEELNQSAAIFKLE